jgi:hypothetical protein
MSDAEVRFIPHRSLGVLIAPLLEDAIEEGHHLHAVLGIAIIVDDAHTQAQAFVMTDTGLEDEDFRGPAMTAMEMLRIGQLAMRAAIENKAKES